MKILGLIVGALIIGLGIIGLVAPGFVVSAQYSLAPQGLYIVAASRMLVGLVLLIAASSSRLPKTLRVFGVATLVVGLTTPLMGFEPSRAILNWSSTHGTAVIRIWGAIDLLIGVLTAFAFARSASAYDQSLDRSRDSVFRMKLL